MVGLLSVCLVAANINFVIRSVYASEGSPNEDTGDWELVWSDEFEGTEINFDNWSFDHPQNGRYNGEIQSYTDQNAWVEDGHLIIEARKETITEPDGQTYDYTSSKLITQGKQTWTYGKIEVRAKMPEGQGMWPAIWMMPEDEPFYGTWPVGGEIDIMEMLGHEPNKIYANIHYGHPKGEAQGTYTLPSGQSFADDFHVYTLEWEPGEIRWYIDGELYNKANNWHSRHPDHAIEFTYPAPFDQPFFLILNISVGGHWPGNPDDTTDLPQQMVVDYVRVYQKDDYPHREKPEVGDGEAREPLPDGNYIYNGGFNVDDTGVKGIPDVANTDYWTYLEGPGGDANLTVAHGELHVGIVSGGTVDYAVQLLQDPVPLKRGATYKASFRAKAEHQRDIIVKIGGGESRGYTPYSNVDPITLSTEWKDYEFEFTMNHATDLRARYEFNMGLDDADVWLADVRLEMVEDAPTTDPTYEPRSPLPDGNYIYNGTFDQGAHRMAFWEFRKDDSADAEPYIGSGIHERRFEALIQDGGNQVQSIQLVQPEVNLEEGDSYRLTFDASADSLRTMQIRFVSTNNQVISEQIVDLDTETRTYTFEFDVDVATDNNVELQFNLGGDDGDVYIDNVFLSRILAWDGIEGNLILNGIFDSLQHWTTELNHAQASFEVDEDGHFKVNITNPGTDTWTIQLYQDGIELENGASYELSFKARSTIERPVLLNLEHGGDYTKYFSVNIPLSDSWETYHYQFTMDHETDLNTKFGFSFGGDGTDAIPVDEHDIYIDDIVLLKLEEEPTPQPKEPKPDPPEPIPEEPDPEPPVREEEDTRSAEETVSTDEDAGGKLPETATNMFTSLLYGLLVFIAGAIFLIVTRKKTNNRKF